MITSIMIYDRLSKLYDDNNYLDKKYCINTKYNDIY